MATLAPKKDGGPNLKFFDSPEILSQFDGVKNWLLKNAKKVYYFFHHCLFLIMFYPFCTKSVGTCLSIYLYTLLEPDLTFT